MLCLCAKEVFVEESLHLLKKLAERAIVSPKINYKFAELQFIICCMTYLKQATVNWLWVTMSSLQPTTKKELREFWEW